MDEKQRKIIHIDMDAFYASIEQRDFPQYRGRPLAVGGSSQRGVISAASYEARRYGVKSAMPVKKALQLCPNLILVPTRFEVYKQVSKQIHEIFHEYTPLVEPLSLDEAFLDITDAPNIVPSATIVAREIRKKIFDKTQLTASAGVSYNKFLAKVCSDENKPNGQFVLPPNEAIDFIAQLPIERFFGIGKVAAKKLHERRIFKGADLQKKSQVELIRLFGKTGSYYYDICRGIDHREVNPDRIRKSIGTERTFSNDLSTEEQMLVKLDEITNRTWHHLQKSQRLGKTVTVKVKFSNFEQITRSKTFADYITLKSQLDNTAKELLMGCSQQFDRGVRLLGVTVSNLNSEQKGDGIQLCFNFEQHNYKQLKP